MSDARETDGDGWSLTKMTVALALVTALFGWGVAAAEYATEAEGWSSVPPPGEAGDAPRLGRRARGGAIRMAYRSFVEFVWNGVVQLPNAPWVAGFVLTERPWLTVLFLCLEAALIGGALLLRKLDAELHGKPVRASDRPAKRRKKRRPTRRPPPGYG